MGWTVLPHATYSPNLAPCNFHLFGPLKDLLQGRCFADSDELEHSVCVKSSDVSEKSFI
jgi:hypothetical protein